MWSAQLNIRVLKKSALPLFNQHTVLCVLLQHKENPQIHSVWFSIQWINDTEPFHNRFCHDCFFFCTLISKKRDYWTQRFLKKKLKKKEKKKPQELNYFPAGQSISEHLLYLHRITKTPARNQPADSSHIPSCRLVIPHLENEVISISTAIYN